MVFQRDLRDFWDGLMGFDEWRRVDLGSSFCLVLMVRADDFCFGADWKDLFLEVAKWMRDFLVRIEIPNKTTRMKPMRINKS